MRRYTTSCFVHVANYATTYALGRPASALAVARLHWAIRLGLGLVRVVGLGLGNS